MSEEKMELKQKHKSLILNLLKQINVSPLASDAQETVKLVQEIAEILN